MDNKTMMQFFEWYLPEDSLLWKRAAAVAKDLKKTGINMVWLPPAYKGADGSKSVGYDVYDVYDLGEFNQKGSVPTKYGTKAEYLDAVKEMQKAGVEVLADVVLNHMMGADETEKVMATEDSRENRNQAIAEAKEISAWTRFTFPERKGKYSDFEWNHTHFSGTDWDANEQRGGIFAFDGKNWNGETDYEMGNFDYLMGADLDMDNSEVIQALNTWGKWYMDTVKMDGFRLDAVKHIGFDFYCEWLKEIRAHVGKDFFTVGEYWSPELSRLTHYLDVTENSLSLFDVPLHFAMYKAATSNGNCDMGALRCGTLCEAREANAVTFVDNHDTQPGQALSSFIPAWFKQHAYALILLQKRGIPCVFYGDYYGIPHDNIPAVLGLPALCKARELCAYGEEHSYFDDNNLVGFTREGDEEHKDSGVAVLMTDTQGGTKKMYVSEHYAGEIFYNILKPTLPPVTIGEDGCGEFYAEDGSVTVWVRKGAYETIQLL